MTGRVLPPGVRLVGARFRPHWFLAFVVDPDTGCEVRVRYEAAKLHRYHCDTHGRSQYPACIHAAAVQLLTRTTERKP